MALPLQEFYRFIWWR